ncbi:MAG: branched-chain amino acid ABC transporter permease [Nanoarchaeota archaeon]|nr:branched-chain amino acid ABC transporter permease [Nanoarchaeota archaeon]
MVLAQLLVNSLIIGAVYALVAAGFSLIYATNRFMHFAHGVSVMVGGYAVHGLYSLLHLPLWLSIIGGVAMTCLLGIGMYKFVYGPLQHRKASNIILLIASIGMLILFQNLVQLLFGASIRTIMSTYNVTFLSFFGVTITPLQMIIFGVAVVLFLFLSWLMKFTKLGRQMRAIADNRMLAGVMGIDHRFIALISFIVGSALAGVAGILIGLEQNLEPSMGTLLMVKGFTGAVIGGVDSVAGAVLGSFVLGVVENVAVWFLPSGYKDGVSFLLLFLFLLFRPMGLLGVNRGVKK